MKIIDDITHHLHRSLWGFACDNRHDPRQWCRPMGSVDIRSYWVPVHKETLPTLFPRQVPDLTALDNFIPVGEKIIGYAVLLFVSRKPNFCRVSAAPDVDLSAALIGG